MIYNDLKNLYTYLKRMNEQFDFSFVEQEELDDFLDVTTDIPQELEIFSRHVKKLSLLKSFSNTLEELNSSEDELHSLVQVQINLGNIAQTINDANELFTQIGVAHNKKLGYVDEKELYYDFGKANVTYKIEDNEEMEMVSKEGMEDLRHELFHLRKYKAEHENQDNYSIDDEELKAFRKWKQEQEALKEVGF